MKLKELLKKHFVKVSTLMLLAFWMFMPKYGYPFIITGWGSASDTKHAYITLGALDRLGGFSETLCTQLTAACEACDYFLQRCPDEYHFIYKDGATNQLDWVASSNAIRLKRQYVKNWLPSDWWIGTFGDLLHTIADHYSHTNWVVYTNWTIDGIDMDSDNPPVYNDPYVTWSNDCNDSIDHSSNPNHNEAVEDAKNETIRQWYKIEDHVFDVMYPNNDMGAKTCFNQMGITPGFNLIYNFECDPFVQRQIALKWYSCAIRPGTDFNVWLYKTVNGQDVPLGIISSGEVNHSWRGFMQTWEVGSYLDGNGKTQWLSAQECALPIKIVFTTGNTWEKSEFLLPALSCIDITSPEDGDEWQLSELKSIYWEAHAYSGNFALGLRMPDDSLKLIANNINLADGAYQWQVGLATGAEVPAGDGYHIELTEINLTEPNCIAIRTSEPFAISYFKIIKPLYGSQWQLNTSQSISWSSPLGKTDSVKLLLYQGSTLKGTIVENLLSSGSYNWTTGNYNGGTAAAGSNYKIRVQTMDGLNYTDSDTFSLVAAPTAEITVTSPNGGESWVKSSNHTITWTNTGTVNNVKIEYSINGGSTWTTQASSVANSLTYSWTLPATTSTNCKVRVSDTGSSGASDVSDNTFAITELPAITVTAPNGGETWEVNGSHNITWSSTGSVANIKIEYSKDGGTSWNPVIDNTTNDGNYTWTAPSPASTACRVRVSKFGDSGVSDTSNANFTISEPDTPSIIVNTPNGGELLKVGNSKNITWSWTGTIANVKIDYTTDNGTTWKPVIDSLANNGSYGWMVPNDLSANCKVRVSGIGSSASDTSNGTFTITDKMITVTAPSVSGLTWMVGANQNITWTSSGAISNVKIEYSTNGGSSWSVVINSTTNSGIYNWTIPNTPSGQCMVRISDSAASTVKDVSDNFFSIAAVPTSISVTAPNGGESWKLGAVKNITWTSSGMENTLEISLWQNGVNKGVIASSVNAAAGLYAWTVGSGLTEVVSGTGCKIQVKENGTSVSDSSNASFTITF